MIDLSVVIINYRMRRNLENCLRSIYFPSPQILSPKGRGKGEGVSFEVILVNTLSEDGTPEMIKEHFKDVKLINTERFGVALSRNVGLRASSGRYILMLDADAMVSGGHRAFDEMVDFMETHKDAGGAGSRTISRLANILEYSCRTFYTLPVILFRRTFLGELFPDSRVIREHLMMDWDHNSVREVDWVAGASFIMRRETVDHIGLFDEKFHFGFEDVDWCYRAKKNGWKIYYFPKGEIIHDVQRASARGFNRMAFEHLKSAFIFYRKNYWEESLAGYPCETEILQVGKFYYPVKGGVENHLYLLCNEIKRDYKTEVLVANEGFKGYSELVNGVKVRRLMNFGRLFSMSFCPSMALWLRKIKTKIIHVHLPNPLADFSYLLARPRGKLLVMYHSDVVRQKMLLPLYRPILFSLLRRAEVIIATSQNYIDSSYILKKFRDKCVVVPLGIELERFKLTDHIQEKVKSIHKRFREDILLFVGRLVYYKGLEYLIEAMQDIPAHLIIIGTGPLEKKLNKMVKGLGLEGKITFLYNISDEDLPAYYHASQAFILPSIERSEAFGIVQLEAMACGKPVISTRLSSGVPFVNLDGETGIV
ncbi:MAG: glycosyltransferase, partial [Candidatus Omnitrophica bacterium]|nr:glycosyltransferase [Candidatus Omnitrophota bacterium]